MAASYDEVPYTSIPFPHTNPSFQRALAFLFGLNTPDPAKARVLELGCAAGANIISIAARFPEADCVGIDLSGVQIAQGQAQVDALGLKNIRLIHGSIMDIDASFGTFDYIISHGILSWVPPEVQEKLFEVCDKNLSPDGIAYISYNTLPGWRAVQAIREMMLYHTQNIESPAEKAAQGRWLLTFLEENAGQIRKDSYAQALVEEQRIIGSQEDWYLLHDHLGDCNFPFYFHEFMAKAGKNNLQYLCETLLSSMLSGNMPKSAGDFIAGCKDTVRREQYIDFLTNRRFRKTLLCHSDKAIDRNIQPSRIAGGFFTSHFSASENLANYRPGSGETIVFTTAEGMTVTTRDPSVIIPLKILAEQNQMPLAMGKLVQMARAVLAQSGIAAADETAFAQMLAHNFLIYILIGGIGLHLSEGLHAIHVTQKPKAFALAAYQAGMQDWVTNMRQEMASLSPFDQALLPLLDGERDLAELTKAMLPHLTGGALSINEPDGSKVTDAKRLEKELPTIISATLQRYAINALLTR